MEETTQQEPSTTVQPEQKKIIKDVYSGPCRPMPQDDAQEGVVR